jgi:HEAT repeats/HEAT repeat
MTIMTIFLASLLLVTGANAASTSLSKSKPLIGFEQGRLSVNAVDVPLNNLLSAIEDKSGIVIDLRDSKTAARRSSVDFKNLLPALAFREILQNLNFAFFYSGTRLARVLILPPGDRASPKAKSELTNPSHIGQPLLRAEHAALKVGATPRLQEEINRDSDVTAKLDAIEAMADTDDPKSIAALGDALTDQNRKVKEAALRVLADKKGPNITQMLRRGLNDLDPEFRIEVLETLADRGDLDSLRKAVADQNPEVRETAADLLGNLVTQK